MKYSVDKQEKYTVFHLQEDNFNSTLAPKMKTELKRLEDEGAPNVILDMTGVRYVDSSALSAILTGHRIWEDLGGTYVVVAAPDSLVVKLLQISHLTDVIAVVPTLDEAIEYVFMEEVERELGDDDPHGV